MRHTCKKLQELRQATGISVSIRGDKDISPGWRLLLIDDEKHIAIGVAISHCPFCGKELEGLKGK